MLPLAGMLFNVVSGLVMDKAQSLAKDHVEDMLDNLLPEEAKEELDKIIADDPDHPVESAKDALAGAIEGKLPIATKDGEFLAIEKTITIRFDPNTKDISIVS